MRSLQLPLALLLGLLGPGLPSARAIGFGLFHNFWGDVIVNTDVTPEGSNLTPPTPTQPVYYRGMSLGPKLGTIVGDREPTEREITQLVARVLARQGYLGAKPGVHEPTLFLVIQWGYLEPRQNDLMWFLGYDPRQDIASPVFPGQLGPEVWRRGMRSHTTETILSNAGGPNYGIIVTAFEYKTARSPKPVVYWQTRIGLPANGKSMDEALPTMILAAGSAIGRPSKTPLLRDSDAAREGTVNLGELEILGVVDENARHAETRPH